MHTHTCTPTQMTYTHTHTRNDDTLPSFPAYTMKLFYSCIYVLLNLQKLLGPNIEYLISSYLLQSYPKRNTATYPWGPSLVLKGFCSWVGCDHPLYSLRRLIKLNIWMQTMGDHCIGYWEEKSSILSTWFWATQLWGIIYYSLQIKNHLFLK